jgi:hypothetical protein
MTGVAFDLHHERQCATLSPHLHRRSLSTTSPSL